MEKKFSEKNDKKFSEKLRKFVGKIEKNSRKYRKKILRKN